MDGIISSAVSGLNAQSRRIGQAAENIVNVNSTGSLDGTGREAYAPKDVLFIAKEPGSVRTIVRPRDPAFVPAYQPDSPDADTNGYVAAPDVNLGEEVITLIQAEHAYKAAASLIPVAKEIHEALIDALK